MARRDLQEELMRLRRILVVGLPILLAPALLGCQASSESVLDQDPLRWCLTKQSWVGETADQDSAGRVGAVSITTNRQYTCEGTLAANETSNAYFEAEARLIKVRVDGSGTFVCAVGIDQVAYYQTSYQAAASARGDCGYGNYWTHGVHIVDRAPPGSLVKGFTTTPNGYNS